MTWTLIVWLACSLPYATAFTIPGIGSKRDCWQAGYDVKEQASILNEHWDTAHATARVVLFSCIRVPGAKP